MARLQAQAHLQSAREEAQRAASTGVLLQRIQQDLSELLRAKYGVPVPEGQLGVSRGTAGAGQAGRTVRFQPREGEGEAGLMPRGKGAGRVPISTGSQLIDLAAAIERVGRQSGMDAQRASREADEAALRAAVSSGGPGAAAAAGALADAARLQASYPGGAGQAVHAAPIGGQTGVGGFPPLPPELRAHTDGSMGQQHQRSRQGQYAPSVPPGPGSMHAPHVPPSLPGSVRGAGAANRMRAGAIPMLGGPSRELAASRQHELRVATAAAAAMGGGPPVAGMGLVRGRSFRFMCRDQEERLRYQSQAASQLLGTLMVMGACSRSPVGVSVAVEASKMVGNLEKLATAADAVAGGSGFDVDGDGSEKESDAGEGLQAVAGKLPREASLSAEDTRLPAHLHSLAKALASVGAPRDQAVPMPRPVQLPDHLRDIYTLLPGASSSRQAASQRKRRRTEGRREGLDHSARERDEDREQREQEEQS